MAVGVLPTMQHSPHCCERYRNSHCVRATERIVELERRCAKHAYNEESSLMALEQLHQTLRKLEEESAVGMGADDDVYRRVQRELEHSRQSSEAALLRITAQNEEAERLHRRIDSVRAENAELAQLSVPEDQASLSAAAALSADVHRIHKETEAKRREIYTLRHRSRESTLECESLREHVERLSKIVGRPDVCDELVQRASFRFNHKLLKTSFARFLDGGRHSRRWRRAARRVANSTAQRQLLPAFTRWVRQKERGMSLRRLVAVTLCRCLSLVLRAWAETVACQRRRTRMSPLSSRSVQPGKHVETNFEWSLPQRRAPTRSFDTFSAWFARLNLLNQTFAGWLTMSEPAKVSRPFFRTAFRVLRRRRVRRIFVALVAVIARSREMQQLVSWFSRRRLLTRGWRTLTEAGAAIHLQRRLVVINMRAVERRLRGPAREIFVSWHRQAVKERQFSKAVAQFQRKCERARRRRLLCLGMALFGVIVVFQRTVHEFRYAFNLRYFTNFLQNAVFPAWRSSVRKSSLERIRQVRAKESFATRAFHGWRSRATTVRRLSAASQRCISACASRRRLAAWTVWRRGDQKTCRMRLRCSVISARQCLSARQRVMAAWRSLLRIRVRERRRSAADSFVNLQGYCREEAAGCGDTAECSVDHDLKWLALMDGLHCLATETAEAQAALEDALSQGSTLVRTREAHLRETEALQAEVRGLEELRQGTSESASQQAAVVEEELRRVLQEHATLRGELRQMGERVRQDLEAQASARRRGDEFEQSLGDSSRVCADLVDDRGRRIAELEAWSQTQQADVARFANALEEQVAAEHRWQTDRPRSGENDACEVGGAMSAEGGIDASGSSTMACAPTTSDLVVAHVADSSSTQVASG
eukprot:TRINITY_DN12435_c0_g1_i2.p1 TRINITY_DN12435_c0_g1~~TRINITY_DN12435_c0_g1_i2.p1  ORF type:complete len:878 (-),score=118.24 TRINITY_DN12435_c0_g1_i2:697-3330(-)